MGRSTDYASLASGNDGKGHKRSCFLTTQTHTVRFMVKIRVRVRVRIRVRLRVNVNVRVRVMVRVRDSDSSRTFELQRDIVIMRLYVILSASPSFKVKLYF